MTLRTRYVELTYTLPGEDDPALRPRFYAVLTEAESPDAAVVEATRELRREHSRAENVAEFMQRVPTPKQEASIRERIADASWHGWPFEERGW